MLRILANADVDDVVVEDRRRDDVVAGALAAELPHRLLRVRIEGPDQLAGVRRERVDHALTARNDELFASAGDTGCRVGPGPVEDLLARVSALPHQFARVLVQGDEARPERRRDVDVTFVDALARGRDDDVADHQGRAGGEIVGEDVQLRDHVEGPHDVRVEFVAVLLVLDAVVAIREAVDVDGDELCPVGDVVGEVAFDVGRRADALKRPVVHSSGGELVVRGLPEKFAVALSEGDQDALVADDAGSALTLVVRADEDLAVVDDRAGVGLGTELLLPLDVPAGQDVPVRRDAGLGGDHVARRGQAEHGRRVLRQRRSGAGRDQERCYYAPLFHALLLGFSGFVSPSIAIRAFELRAVSCW